MKRDIKKRGKRETILKENSKTKWAKVREKK
jgi:hypothetical protein